MTPITQSTQTASETPMAQPMPRLYISCDSAAVAVGADEVAAAATALGAEVWRTSSRGLFWLEPLVEVDTPAGRVGYGPCDADDVAAILRDHHSTSGTSGTHDANAPHAKALGLVEAIPYLQRQQRLTFARAGITRPLSLDDYAAHGGWAGLKAAAVLSRATPDAIWQSVLDSGLRGRGGAAFPAGIKWRTVAQTGSQHAADQKYVVCNADEGDSGTFADRMVLEGDPYLLIEGMAIAGLSSGATMGYVYIRSEYPAAVHVFSQAVALARAAGYLGADVCGSGKTFELEVRKAAGSYVCGEETAMLESIEGKRGIVRAKPPIPALQGLFGRPTIINNALTFAAAPLILHKGPAFYKNFGMGRSTGTLPFQVAGNVKQGGLVEVAFGVTLRELLFDFGGGTASGRPVKAVQVGGPLGTYLPESQWDIPLDYEAYAAIGAVVGHGGLVVHDDTADMAKLARYAMEFCAIESCGKCTPCRIGSTRGAEVISKIIDNKNRPQQVRLLRDLCDTMVHGSLCAMGAMTPYPVLSALNHFPADFGIEHDGLEAA